MTNNTKQVEFEQEGYASKWPEVNASDRRAKMQIFGFSLNI